MPIESPYIILHLAATIIFALAFTIQDIPVEMYTTMTFTFRKWSRTNADMPFENPYMARYATVIVICVLFVTIYKIFTVQI